MKQMQNRSFILVKTSLHRHSILYLWTLCSPEYDELVAGQWSGGIPGTENHSIGHSNGASSWFPKTLAHGMPLALVGESAWSQYKLAFAIGILLAVMTSPRYITKSAVPLCQLESGRNNKSPSGRKILRQSRLHTIRKLNTNRYENRLHTMGVSHYSNIQI